MADFAVVPCITMVDRSSGEVHGSFDLALTDYYMGKPSVTAVVGTPQRVVAIDRSIELEY